MVSRGVLRFLWGMSVTDSERATNARLREGSWTEPFD
jgi:hypothetical protein